MSEQTRRFLERTLQTSATATFIAADSVFVGNIRTRGQFVVFGEVHGDGELDSGLHIAASGIWRGNIRVRQAIIAGTLFGGLVVSENLEIGHTAVIRGSVSAGSIAIARGAIVEGSIEITSGAPVLEFEERREGR